MGIARYFVVCPRCDFVYARFHAYDCEFDPVTKYKELTSLVIDLEDAVGDSELVDCEAKLIEDISELYALYQQKQLLLQELPLLLFEYDMLSNFKS